MIERCSRTLVALAAVALLLGASSARAEPSTVAVVDAEPVGVAPESAAAVTRQMYATVARLGYLAVPEDRTRAAATAPHAGTRTAADLYAIAVATHAEHALSATLGALGERYAVSVTLANADRTGPFVRTAVTDAASLEVTVDSLTRGLLPPAPGDQDVGNGTAARGETARPPPKAVHRISLNTEGAVGLTSGINESTTTKEPTFYNQVVGPRFDYGFPNDFAAGLFVGYANLKGMNGRVSNVLSYVQLEYRTRVSKSSDFRIPLRFAVGYLPKDGPFLRLAAGVNFPLGNGVHLGLDLVAPAFWVIESQNRTVLSLDGAAEVGFDL